MAAPAPLAGLAGEQVICTSADEAATRLAAALSEEMRLRLQSLAHAHLALSGGGSGKLLATALARRNELTAALWARIHVWQVDERAVPSSDPQSNFRMLRESLEAAPLAADNLHPMPVLHPDGAQRYEQELHWALVGRAEPDRSLDAVVLGLGTDGHTASLFPESPALDESERWIVINDGDHVTAPRPRMTMTFPLLNQARFLAFLVTGSSKREALRRLAARREDYRSLPASRIAPVGRLMWFLDEDVLGKD